VNGTRGALRRAPRRAVVLLAGTLALLSLVIAVVGRSIATELAAVRDPHLGSARSTTVPRDDGPVMVLGGSRDRVEAALELHAIGGPGRELIASAGAAEDLVALGHDCDAPGIRCVTPEPLTTRGEARLAARLAQEEGWKELTAITSSWHVHRARRHLEACLTIPLSVVPVAPEGSEGVPLRLALREALGALDARLRPECRDLAP
jgi:uncharacterized SAM-binding protein YcdF (DUF218 family)